MRSDKRSYPPHKKNSALGRFFAFIFSLTLLPAAAQTSTANAELHHLLPDSIMQLFEKSNHDTARCDILSRFIEQEGDMDVWGKVNVFFLQMAKNGMNKAQENSAEHSAYVYLLSSAYNNQGLFLQEMGQNNESAQAYNSALALQKKYMGRFPSQRMLSLHAATLNNLGLLNYRTGNNPKALLHFSDAEKIYKKMGDKHGLGYCYGNMGLVYDVMGNKAETANNFLKALKLREETGDKFGMSLSLASLGDVYEENDQPEKALDCFQKAARLKQELHDKRGESDVLNQIANFYYNRKDPKTALEYFGKIKKMREEIGDQPGLLHVMNNIGTLYKGIGQYDKAIDILKEVMRVREKTKDRPGLAVTYSQLGSAYSLKRKWNESVNYYAKSLALARETGKAKQIEIAYGGLYVVYEASGDHQKALKCYKMYIGMRDSLESVSSKKASLKAQLKYEYEKQAAADSVAFAREAEVKNIELSKQAAEIKAKKTQQYILLGGLLVVGLFGALIFNRYRTAQKQNLIIEEQKQLVEEQKTLVEIKQREILESMQYARRIQFALLPSEKIISKLLRRLRR